MTPAVTPTPAAAPPLPAVAVETPAPTAPGPGQDLTRLYGVRCTSQGVLFVQPGSVGRSLAIAGDFNRWSAASTPLTYDEQLDVFQAIVPVEPGRHQYRLVIDGRWQADPYNPDQVHNSYGELNSVFRVEPEHGHEPSS